MQKLCLGCMNPAADTEVCPHCGYVEGTPPKEPYHIPPGTMLRKYLIGRVLGYGGFGVTYLGYDTQFNIKVAIKEYLPGELATRMPGDTKVTVYSGEKTVMFETGREKFLDEARRLAKFTAEPGIVSIQDEFDENGTCYIIMEFLEGETLKTKLEREGKLSVDEAVQIITPILDALTAVHEKSIIHRDISPDNIFLTNDGRIKLLDFGAARYAGSHQSKSLSVILKPGYAPEEQYRSRGDQGPWSDVYACAATVYKMITGITPEDAMERTLKDEVKPPSKLGVKINKNSETAIMNAMNIYKDNRTQSAQEFKEQLSGTVDVTRIRNTHKLMDIGNWKTWHKVLLASILSLLVIVIGISAVAVARDPSSIPMIPIYFDAQVPDVVRMTAEDARETAEKANLTPMIINGDYSDSIEFGTIVNQSIDAGKAVQKKSYLEMVMSLGRHSIELPDLSGREQDEVFRTLSEAGFLVQIAEEYSNYAPGTVIRQEPEPGLYETGTAVLIAVSLGLENIDENTTVTLDNYIGRQFAEVQKELEAAGIYIRKETVYSTQKEGMIIAQGASKGEEVKQGYELKLTVSLGEQTVRIGNYYAWNLQDAQKELEAMGVKVKWEYVDNELYARDLVISQTPAAGTAVLPKSTTVTLTVSKGRDQSEVPNVIEMSRTDALRTLSDAGFLVTWVEAYSDYIASGYVMEQDPAGGYAYVGQTINVTVSKGKAANVPTGLRLNQVAATMYYPSPNANLTLIASIIPANADDQRIIWSTNNANVAVVSADGVVQAIGIGTATITAKTNTGGITVSCRVTVQAREIASVSIGNPADVQQYYQGAVLSTSGLTLIVTYNSGEREVVQTGFSGAPTKMETVGDQKVTISYNGFTVSYTVKVLESELRSISVKTKPSRTVYQVGDTLDMKGLTLNAVYADRTETVDSGFSCSPTMLPNIGEQLITVTYSGKTTSFYITVNEPAVQSVTIERPPYQLDYITGSELNTSGLRLLITYENGSTKYESTAFSCSPSLLSRAGDQTVTVTYNGKTATFTVHVEERKLEAIKIRTQAKITDYVVGDSLDIGGLTIYAIYNDGTQETLNSGFTCSPPLLTKAGSQTITIDYGGKTTSYTVNVSEDIYLTGISLLTPPSQTVFLLNDEVTFSDMVLEASYSDGKQAHITGGWNIIANTSHAGNTVATVQYTENGITKEQLVSILVIDTGDPENTYSLPVLVGADSAGYAGETVAFRVFLFNNPGYARSGVRIVYDPELDVSLTANGKPENATGSASDELLVTVALNADRNIIGVGTIGTGNEMDDGLWLTLYLVIPPDAVSGTEYAIQLEIEAMATNENDPIDFEIYNGSIFVL